MKENLKIKTKREKLSKDQKKARKIQRQIEFLNKKGIPQLWSTFIFESIFIFIIEMIFKILFGSLTLDFTILRILLSSSIFAILLSLITTNMNQKLRKAILIIFNLFIVFYAWLQLGLVDYLGTFMSVGNAEQGTKITDYIGDFLCSYDFKVHLIYVPFILSCLYYAYERYIIRDGYGKKINIKNLFSVLICIVIFAILSISYYITFEADFMQNKYQIICNKDLIKYPSNPSIAIKNFGTSVYFILDLKTTIFGGVEGVYAVNVNGDRIESKTRDIDDTAWEELIKTESNKTLNILNNYFINRKISEKNEYTGIFKDKNLIFIMLESVSQAVFDEEYKEYFPTLYKLYTEGMSGINNYSPKNNCTTGESEMTSQISLYSMGTTCTVNTYKKNIYPEAIMSMLRNNGYYTSAYHNYTDQYYDRNTIEYNFGSSVYYGVKALGIKYSDIYKEWPSDVEFMEKALPKFIGKEKFASYMVTVSAHTPYMYSSKIGDKYLSLFKDLELDKSTKRYLSKVKEVDLALQYILDELEEKDILDETVLVIFGDHYPYGLSDKQYQSIANFDISVNQEIDRTPFIIYNSETEAREITKYTTPLDYTPTLLNLFGIDYDPRLYMGNDVFSDYTDFALFPDNSWQSEYGYYSTSKDEFIIDKDSKSTLTDEEVIKINREVNELRNMSALAIKNNYFKYLYEHFEEYAKLKEEVETEE